MNDRLRVTPAMYWSTDHVSTQDGFWEDVPQFRLNPGGLHQRRRRQRRAVRLPRQVDQNGGVMSCVICEVRERVQVADKPALELEAGSERVRLTSRMMRSMKTLSLYMMRPRELSTYGCSHACCH